MSQSLVGDRQFKNDLVRISDLTVTTPVLEGYQFSNCQIIGPAVLLVLNDVGIASCGFEGDLDSMFWEISADRAGVIGAVAVRDCLFSACVFRGVGFAGTSEFREMFSAGFSDE